jgi:type IV pilus assembly protein PilA
VVKRPGVVTFFAVLQFIGGAIALASAALCLGAAATQDEGQAIIQVIAGLFAIAGVVQVVCGIGLLTLKPYGRTLQIALAILGLVFIPVGTIISIFILVYMFKPGLKVLFSGRPAAELTPEELNTIDALRQGSAVATVLIILFVVFGGVAMIGIVAAIAIPGLFRARMAANESSALASLRTIKSAEASYAAAAGNGGYAIALATLAQACPGSSQGFISPDLSGDPSFKSGYAIGLASAGAAAGPNDCHGARTEVNYYATAAPLTIGTTGSRGFSTAVSGTIFYDPSGVPPSLADTLAATARAVGQ